MHYGMVDKGMKWDDKFEHFTPNHNIVNAENADVSAYFVSWQNFYHKKCIENSSLIVDELMQCVDSNFFFLQTLPHNYCT